MKKILFVLVLMLLPMVASAYDVVINGIYYNYLNDGKELEVTFKDNNYNSYSGVVNVPDKVTYEGKTMAVTRIGSSAFYHCNGLTSITIPNSVTRIGNDAFSNCSGLTSINIPYGVTSIYGSTFLGCSSLTSIIIPNNVTSIGSNAFYDCSGLTSITIPNSVTSIDGSAFIGCISLTSIQVESGNSVYDSRDNCHAIIETSTNTLLIGCQNTIIPNSVTSIGWAAFCKCSGLASIIIPNSVTSIGSNAFSGCSGLASIIIPNSVTSIGGYAFSGCSKLISVTIGNSVTSIGYYAFKECSGLASVTIGNSVTSIGYMAFGGCSSLTSINIPNSVTSIGSWTFASCSGLTSVTIGSGIKEITTLSFANCSKLTDFYCYAENVPTASDAFYNSNIGNATLHVPDASVSKYAQTAPWSGFKSIVGAPAKCATPTITIVNGKLTFDCETEGASINASYSYNGGNVVGKELALAGITTCHVKVYASKEGYMDSDVATADVELCVGQKGDVNQDGKITITDAVTVVNIILNNGEATAPAMEGPALEAPEVGEPE